MNYTSTRDSAVSVTSAKAIADGISPDGGLYLPDSFPVFSIDEISALSGMNYAGRAKTVLRKFLTDFSDDELTEITNASYGDNFGVKNAVALRETDVGEYSLELWHGPTAAFKDMALQILPHLLTKSVEKIGKGASAANRTTAILVATSGDTGKAALEGFRDVPGTKLLVFYPANGVSTVQRLQMATQLGGNVCVQAVEGNFDDCQNAVKAIFTDDKIANKLAEKNIYFSSANSINWGRLAPQIAYYFSAYADLLSMNKIKPGDKINICVPTGNFGNILAAYYAGECGLPLNKLICASNSNNVLTDFIRTGVYDRSREFFTTVSPSMDILISSNLERLLYILSGKNDGKIREWFGALKSAARYEVDIDVKNKLARDFYGGYCGESGTKATVKAVWEARNYLMDTHTAVAYAVYRDYKSETGDLTPTVIASTANPYKFVRAIYEAVSGENPGSTDEFVLAGKLEKLTGTKMPPPLAAVKSLPVRFTGSLPANQLTAAVEKFLL